MAKAKAKKGSKVKKKIKKIKKKQPGSEYVVTSRGASEATVVDQEDLDFYQNCYQNLDFLTSLKDDGSISTKAGKKRKLKNSDLEEEAEYEKRPRTREDDQTEREHVLLPYKDKKGVIQRVGIKIDAVDTVSKTSDNVGEESEPLMSSPSNTPPTFSVVELFALRQQKLDSRKRRIAELSNKIMESPEDNVSLLKELCSYCEEPDVDVRLTTRKLAMLSLLTVFKDITPGYHLRLPTEAEKEVKVSKDVKRLRDYEEGVLLTYQKYLQILEKNAQGSKIKRKNGQHTDGTATGNESLVKVAVQCQCDLLTNLSHFNYHTNLMAVLVPRMDDVRYDGQVSKVCCEAFKNLFKTDLTGNVSLEAVKLISKYVKTKSYRVNPCILEILLSLRINEMDVMAMRDNNNNNKPEKTKGHNRQQKIMKGKMSKKDRKRQKEMKKLDKELQEVEAVESHQKVAKTHTEILKFVFLIYFRVLKNAPQSPLLSPVLEGLGTYAHLINVDFFSDLMAAMNTVTAMELSLRETLNCVLTAFKILSGQGEALNIDPRGFYCTLYSSLLRLHAGVSCADVDVAIKCLEVMMHKRRKQVPTQRVSAFIKRLSTVALHGMPNSSLAQLAFVRTFFQVFSRCQTLLDSDSLGTGLFRPEVEDPEMSNTESTACWELSTLGSRHFHPTVRTFASTIMSGCTGKGANSQLTRISPGEFYRTYDSSEMKLNPDVLESTRKSTTKLSRSYLSLQDLEQSSLSPAIDTATAYTDECLENVVFTLPSKTPAR